MDIPGAGTVIKHQCQHPLWAPVQVPATTLQIQHLANVTGKAPEDGSSAWASLNPSGRTGGISMLLASARPSSAHGSQLGSELGDGKGLSSVSPPHSM